MSELFESTVLAAHRTERLVAAYFARVAPTASRLLRLVDAVRRHETAVLGVWFQAATIAAAGDPTRFDDRRRRSDFERELEGSFEGRPATPLGRELARVAVRHGLDPEPFRTFLDAVAEEREVRARETRGELIAHCRRRAVPIGRSLLPVLARDTDRSRALSDALCTGVQLAHWWSRVGRDWRLDARVMLPVEDLTAHGIGLREIAAGGHRDRLRAVMEDAAHWAREWLGRGWGLTAECGPWRGRLLAYYVRRVEHGLRRVEARGAEILADAPAPSRWCAPWAALASSASRARPRSLPAPRPERR